MVTKFREFLSSLLVLSFFAGVVVAFFDFWIGITLALGSLFLLSKFTLPATTAYPEAANLESDKPVKKAAKKPDRNITKEQWKKRKRDPYFVANVLNRSKKEEIQIESTILNRKDLVTNDEYIITYEDSQGSVSNRTVIYKSLSKKGSAQYMKAYCTDRRAIRTFRVERISSMISAQTGEVLI